MQAPVSPGTCSQLPSLQHHRSQNPDPRRWIWEGTAHLFLPSVLTLMGAPRRDGPRKREPGPLMVSVDFQLSVLELVAELLRTAPSFLVIIDQQFLLRDGHKSRAWCGDGLRYRWDRPWESVVVRGSWAVEVEMERGLWMSWKIAWVANAVRARPRPQVCARGVQEKRHQLSISYSWIFI